MFRHLSIGLYRDEICERVTYSHNAITRNKLGLLMFGIVGFELHRVAHSPHSLGQITAAKEILS